MLDLQHGAITIDGLDISKLPREQIRSRLNAIPQEPYLLAGTIRSNIDPLNLAPDDAVIAALQKVHLWDLVESKGGPASRMNDKTFSPGQRQLICLARALMRKSSILVLDEVTSSVDIDTDKLMQKIIRDEFPTQTIIAIAHRLDTVIDFDKIAVLEHGKLVEYDSPEVLLSYPSAFRELYMTQKGQEVRDVIPEEDEEDLEETEETQRAQELALAMRRARKFALSLLLGLG